MIRKLITVAACILSAVPALLLTGCEHKDLCYHHPHQVRLRVVFDWMDAPDAAPDGMTIYFYPTDVVEGQSADPYRFDFVGREGGEIELPQGHYRAITYNNDTELLNFYAIPSFEDHYATTRRGSLFEPIYGSGSKASGPRAKGSEDEAITITPDMLWGCTATDIYVSTTGVSYICVPEKDKDNYIHEPVVSKDQVITLYPHEMVCHYTYEIRNVKNMQYIQQMSASLSGMAPLVRFNGDELGRECVTHPVETFKSGADKIVGSFLVFGHHPDNTAPHRMLLYVWLTNGEKIYFGSSSPRFDVTDQIHSAPDKRRVHIIIDGLDIPKPMGDGPGFDPSVDDWQDEDHDIEI